MKRLKIVLQSKYLYYVETLKSGKRIYLERPANLHNGFDFVVNVEDEIFYLKPGDFIFIPKGIEHKTDSEDCMYNERMLLSIDESVFDESTHHILNELSEIKIIHIPKNSLYEIDDLMHKLEQEYFKSNIHKNTMIKLYILEILVKLCRLNKKEETVINDGDEIKLIQIIYGG